MRYTWAPIVTLIWLLAFVCRPQDRVASTAVWAAVICVGLIIQAVVPAGTPERPKEQAADAGAGSQAVKPGIVAAILSVLAAAIIGYIVWAVWL